MATTLVLRNEGTDVERSKHKAKSDLISALIQYRESAKAAGRCSLSEWAHVKLAQVAALSHVSEDVRVEEAVTAFHNSHVAPKAFAVDMMREFRSLLRDDELESLVSAHVAPGDILVQVSHD
jgi:hypothetical protein